MDKRSQPHEEATSSTQKAELSRSKRVWEDTSLHMRGEQLSLSHKEQQYIEIGKKVYEHAKMKSDERRRSGLTPKLIEKCLLDLSYSQYGPMAGEHRYVDEEQIPKFMTLKKERAIKMSTGDCYYISIDPGQGNMQEGAYNEMMHAKFAGSIYQAFRAVIDPSAGKMLIFQGDTKVDAVRVSENFVGPWRQDFIEKHGLENPPEQLFRVFHVSDYAAIAYKFITLQNSLRTEMPKEYDQYFKNEELHDQLLKMWHASTRSHIDRPVPLTELVGVNIDNPEAKALLFPLCKPGEQRRFTPKDEMFHFVLGISSMGLIPSFMQYDYPGIVGTSKMNEVVIHRTADDELNIIIRFDTKER